MHKSDGVVMEWDVIGRMGWGSVGWDVWGEVSDVCVCKPLRGEL